jgi:methionine-rich copper-binding protein CopC
VRRALVVCSAIALLAPLFGRSPAAGHARLVRAVPAPGSTVTAPPPTVRVWFKLDPNEELDPRRSALSVWDAGGRRVDDGKGGVDLNDLTRLSLIARLRPLRPGTYTVRWKAVSTPDLGARRGTFRFAVAKAMSLPPLVIISPRDGSTVSSPVQILFETSADLANMTMGASGIKDGMPMGGVHLHADLDGRLVMPTLKQITTVGMHRYRVSLGRAAPGRHTIRAYWADSKHRPMSAVQRVTITVK